MTKRVITYREIPAVYPEKHMNMQITVSEKCRDLVSNQTVRISYVNPGFKSLDSAMNDFKQERHKYENISADIKEKNVVIKPHCTER